MSKPDVTTPTVGIAPLPPRIPSARDPLVLVKFIATPIPLEETMVDEALKAAHLKAKIIAAKRLSELVVHLKDGKDYIDDCLPEFDKIYRAATSEEKIVDIATNNNTTIAPPTCTTASTVAAVDKNTGADIPLLAKCYVALASVRLLAHGWGWSPSCYGPLLDFISTVISYYNGEVKARDTKDSGEGAHKATTPVVFADNKDGRVGTDFQDGSEDGEYEDDEDEDEEDDFFVNEEEEEEVAALDRNSTAKALGNVCETPEEVMTIALTTISEIFEARNDSDSEQEGKDTKEILKLLAKHLLLSSQSTTCDGDHDEDGQRQTKKESKKISLLLLEYLHEEVLGRCLGKNCSATPKLVAAASVLLAHLPPPPPPSKKSEKAGSNSLESSGGTKRERDGDNNPRSDEVRAEARLRAETNEVKEANNQGTASPQRAPRAGFAGLVDKLDSLVTSVFVSSSSSCPSLPPISSTASRLALPLTTSNTPTPLLEGDEKKGEKDGGLVGKGLMPSSSTVSATPLTTATTTTGAGATDVNANDNSGSTINTSTHTMVMIDPNILGQITSALKGIERVMVEAAYEAIEEICDDDLEHLVKLGKIPGKKKAPPQQKSEDPNNTNDEDGYGYGAYNADEDDDASDSGSNSGGGSDSDEEDDCCEEGDSSSTNPFEILNLIEVCVLKLFLIDRAPQQNKNGSSSASSRPIRYDDPKFENLEKCGKPHWDRATTILACVNAIKCSPWWSDVLASSQCLSTATTAEGEATTLDSYGRSLDICFFVSVWRPHRFHSGSEFEMIESMVAYVAKSVGAAAWLGACSSVGPKTALDWICCKDPLA